MSHLPRRIVIVPVALVVVVAVIVATITHGASGLLGALAGGALVVVFLGSTPLLLTPMVAASPVLSMPAALGFFTVKAATAAVVLLVLFDVAGMSEIVSRPALGFTALAASLVWTVAAIVAFRKDRTPIYDLRDET